MQWVQDYDPTGWAVTSVLLSALPIALLLIAIAVFRVRTHVAALLALGCALLIAVVGFGMPVQLATGAAAFGAAYGLLPIGWLLLNILFLYQLTLRSGAFAMLQREIVAITPDRRLQLLLIAFGFGAFFEGCAGFGAPVAITGAMLTGLGFSPIAAARLSLIANTAPVAFGSLGTPIIALSAVTGLPLHDLSAMVGRQLPFFSMLIPFWLILAFAGWRAMVEIWPAIAVAGISFAVPQYLVSNFHGPWLVDIVSASCSIGSLALFLRWWHPERPWKEQSEENPSRYQRPEQTTALPAFYAWLPWLILCGGVVIWGLPGTRAALDALFSLRLALPGLDQMVVRMPPVVPVPEPENMTFSFNILSATGTGILLSALVAGLALRIGMREMIGIYGATIRLARLPLLTIATMLALGYVTRYSGADSILGLTLAKTGMLYPFFGTFLGWLGVAATGSDTASNVLFGGLQKTSAEQLGISPVLMAAANSTGGVMGKMADAQSIVVAATATGIAGKEAEILRYVLFHSIALAGLVALFVLGQAYLWPLNLMVVG